MVSVGSSVSVGFGIWHLFVPKLWKWYSYIDPHATELILAVRAINVFFSVSLILFGIVTILLMSTSATMYARAIILAAVTILWLTRVVFQLIFPQGSMNHVLQYGMLAVFVLEFLCFAISLCIVLYQKK